MISSTHILTGAAVGLAIGRINPDLAVTLPAAIVAGLISHHLFDMIPHTDPGSFRQANDSGPARGGEVVFALVDNIIGTALVLYLFSTGLPSWTMLFGAAAANLPDVWHNVGWWSNWTRRAVAPAYFSLHEKLHYTARGRLIPLGIATNLLLIAVSLFYLFR